MPDIAMCRNKDCHIKQRCYRYTAKPCDRQSYSQFKYDNGCDYFMDNYSAEEWKELKKKNQ